MTIAVGFKCNDGIVIAADRQMTFTSQFKYPENKIFEFRAPLGSFVVTYCGEPDVVREFNDEVMGIVPPNGGAITDSMLRSNMDETTESLHRRHSADVSAVVLCAICVEGRLVLFKCDTEKNSCVEVTDVECIGAGNSSLVRFLLNAMRPRGFLMNPRRLSAQAVQQAIYLIFAAKRYVDGCGHETDVQVLTKDGKFTIYMTPATRDSETQLLIVEELIGTLAWTMLDPRRTDPNLDRVLDEINKRVRDFRLLTLNLPPS